MTSSPTPSQRRGDARGMCFRARGLLLTNVAPHPRRDDFHLCLPIGVASEQTASKRRLLDKSTTVAAAGLLPATVLSILRTGEAEASGPPRLREDLLQSAVPLRSQ